MDVDTLKRFVWFAVAGSAGLTLAAGAAGYAWNAAAGKGLLLGGITGTLVFLLRARVMSRIAAAGRETLKSSVFAWSLAGWVLYAAALVKGYAMDPAGYRAFFGVAAGLLIVRVVVTILGATGLDLKA